jgi:hypothetical protein
MTGIEPMKQLLIAFIVALTFVANALAAEPRLLHKGDVLDVEEGVTLTRPILRNALREYGYKNFGPGGIRGHIWTITAYGHDRNRYQIKVHWKTHEVTQVTSPRNFWY